MANDKTISALIKVAEGELGYLEKNQTASLTARQPMQEVTTIRNTGEILSLSGKGSLGVLFLLHGFLRKHLGWTQQKNS